MSNLARRFGISSQSHDSKLKTPPVVAPSHGKPSIAAVRETLIDGEARRLISELMARVETLELRYGNAQPVTVTVTQAAPVTKRSNGNALTAAEKQRAYRERKAALKAKS